MFAAVIISPLESYCWPERDSHWLQPQEKHPLEVPDLQGWSSLGTCSLLLPPASAQHGKHRLCCQHWGSLYTMAKNRDHESVKAVETHPKAILWKIGIEFGVVTGLQVWCKYIHDQALNRMLFHMFYPCELFYSGVNAKSNRPWNILLHAM